MLNVRKLVEVRRLKRFMDNMINNNVDNYIEYSHDIYKILPALKSHLHGKFEIYLFISGKVNFFVEKNVYNLKYGDLIIVNSDEIHKASFLENDIYERIVITFDPHVIKLLNLNCLNLFL
jgi:mannose-6-phosphate isomerase-like protein (cupin superfamily)